MESFALWYDGELGCEAKVNINIWKSADKKGDYVIDFGFLLYNCQQVNFIEIYIPQKIKESDISDLGRVMISDDVVCRAIFNSKINSGSSRTDHEEYEKNITIIDQNLGLMLLSFAESRRWSLTAYDTFSVIQFRIKEFLDGATKNAYFRFRINNFDKSIIAIEENPKFWFFQSAITCVETLEFRLNDHRLFNRFVIEELETKKLFKLNSTHLFIMRQPSEELIDEHDLSDIRLLEKDIWHNYIQDIKVAEKTVAYHYKNSKSSDDVSFFCRIKYPSIKWKFIIGYVIIVILLAITANLLTDVIISLL